MSSPMPPRTLSQTAEALADGRLSSRALCEELLDRVDLLDPRIGAFVFLDRQEILEAAAAADERRQNGRALSRFDGLPIAVKDNIAVTGQPSGCASKILENYISPYDATVIEKLRNAGLIFFGRTNMDEFAMGSSTEHSAIQETCNPWNSDCVTGGSSGGSAAAVAAGQVLAALGSDTGGSIRQPASFCGTVGLKPSYGRVSRYGLVAFASSLDQIGPITRSVEDAALLLDLISGEDPRDSTSLPAGDVSCLEAVQNADLNGVKVGLPQQYLAAEGLAPDVRDAIKDAADTMVDLGAEIKDVKLPDMNHAIAAYYIIATAEASANLARYDGIRYGKRDKEAEKEGLARLYSKSRAQGFGDEVKRRIILGTYVLSSGYYDAYYLRAQKARTLIRRQFLQAFEKCDIILAPTAPTPAFRKGEKSTPLEMYLADIYTVSMNLAGICGLSLPCGFSEEGLPIGLQILGPVMGEPQVLAAGHLFEQAISEKMTFVPDLT